MELINGQTVGILLFFIGLFGIMTKKSIIKTIISMSVMDGGIYLFFVTVNYRPDTLPPIGQPGPIPFSDPVPSALMITSIVIGIGVTAIALTMFMHYKQKHGITHWAIQRDDSDEDQLLDRED